MKGSRFVLAIVGGIFTAFGLWALLAPVHFTGLTEVQLPTPTAVTDARAVFGGLELGLGSFLLWSASSAARVQPGLLALLLGVGGLLTGRVLGLVVDSSASTPTFQALGIEIVFLVLGTSALLHERGSRSTR